MTPFAPRGRHDKGQRWKSRKGGSSQLTKRVSGVWQHDATPLRVSSSVRSLLMDWAEVARETIVPVAALIVTGIGLVLKHRSDDAHRAELRAARREAERQRWREVAGQVVPNARDFVRVLTPILAETPHDGDDLTRLYERFVAIRSGLGRLSVEPTDDNVVEAAEAALQRVRHLWSVWRAAVHRERRGEPWWDDDGSHAARLQRNASSALDDLVTALRHERHSP